MRTRRRSSCIENARRRKNGAPSEDDVLAGWALIRERVDASLAYADNDLFCEKCSSCSIFLAAREDKLAQQRALIQVLQIEERHMVTENAVLLKRILDAEAEVERQKRHNACLITERDRAMKPVPLPRGPKS
ncbi:hypothetical protein C8J32_11616 [Rhizobium sp. PP-CC-3A-592]|nr:hypothetical protein C8J32_11616 [Rhizobium sp. PP-CC-3A-592]